MILELTDTNYSEIVSSTDKAIFIDFYSPTCGPCQEILPLLNNLDAYFKDEVIIAKVNVTKNSKLAAKYEISSVPFCVSIGAKDKMVKEVELGVKSINRYIKMIEKAQGKGFFSKLFGK